MKVAVVDDCREDASAIENFMCGHEVRLYSDAEGLIYDMEENGTHFDLYLLDIYIDNSINGIELAKRIRSADEDAVICFVSTSDDFYREAYDLYAFQYLIKPVGQETIRRLLDKVEKNFVRDKKKSLSYTWRKTSGSIPYGQILFISSREHTLSIYCSGGRIQKSMGKLNDMELQVDSSVFCRCHQSFLVNMYQVQKLDGYELVVADYNVPISRRYYMKVKRRYQEILFEEVE